MWTELTLSLGGTAFPLELVLREDGLCGLFLKQNHHQFSQAIDIFDGASVVISHTEVVFLDKTSQKAVATYRLNTSYMLKSHPLLAAWLRHLQPTF